jgi:hypothetical protein
MEARLRFSKTALDTLQAIAQGEIMVTTPTISLLRPTHTPIFLQRQIFVQCP